MKDQHAGVMEGWAAAGGAPDADSLVIRRRAEESFRLHAGDVLGCLRRGFGRVEVHVLEDAVQATFLKYWGALRDGEEFRDDVHWLKHVARNEVLTRLKRDKRWTPDGEDLLQQMEEQATDRLTVHDTLMSVRQQECFEAAVAALSGIEAACFALRMQNRTLREIGAEVGLDLRRVAELLERVSRQIRAKVLDAAR